MESVERLQRRIDTLGELHTIVRTMKALSAVSIRQYERAAQALDDYYRTVELGLHVVLKDMESPPSPLHRRGEAQRLAAIVFGSDHGLCGRFNEDIAAFALQRMEASTASPEGRRLLAVGSRVAANLEQASIVHFQNEKRGLFCSGARLQLQGHFEDVIFCILRGCTDINAKLDIGLFIDRSAWILERQVLDILVYHTDGGACLCRRGFWLFGHVWGICHTGITLTKNSSARNTAQKQVQRWWHCWQTRYMKEIDIDGKTYPCPLR